MRSDPHFRAQSNPIRKDNEFIFYPRALNITWGNDTRYWMLSNPYTEEENSFAELKQVSWLEVTGSTKENLKSEQRYKVSFQVSLRPDAFGWNQCNFYIMAKIGKSGKFKFQQLDLINEAESATRKSRSSPLLFKIPRDGLSIQVPNFESTPDSDRKLYFGLYEVWSKRWKGGLRIHSAIVEMDG